MQVLDAEDEIWETILNKIGMVVKTQLEVYDRITTKANDLSLEPLLAANPGKHPVDPTVTHLH